MQINIAPNDNGGELGQCNGRCVHTSFEANDNCTSAEIPSVVWCAPTSFRATQVTMTRFSKSSTGTSACRVSDPDYPKHSYAVAASWGAMRFAPRPAARHLSGWGAHPRIHAHVHPASQWARWPDVHACRSLVFGSFRQVVDGSL